MLDCLSHFARRIRVVAPLLAVMTGLLLLAIVVLILTAGASAADRWLTTGIALLIWILCGWVFIKVFATVPRPPEPALRGLPRLLRRLNRAFHWLLALVLAGIFVASLQLTTRLLGG